VVSVVGMKLDTIGVAVSLSAQKAGFYTYKRDSSLFKFETGPTKVKLTGFSGVMAGLKAWL